MTAWRTTGSRRQGQAETHLSYQEKFLSLLLKLGDDECWRVNVGVNTDPLNKYCTFSWRHPEGSETKSYMARKVSYEIFNGAVTPGLMVITTCKRVGCVNPKHLALANKSEATKHKSKAHNRGYNDYNR